MKRFFTVQKPDYILEDWPGKYDAFSWLEFGVTVPNPMFIVTTLKDGHVPNANLQSWGLLLGNLENGYFLMAMLNHHHTYANILQTGEWCINYISKSFLTQAFRTIENNQDEADEITASDFTLEPSKVIKTPSIAESNVSLECRLAWERPLFEGSTRHLFCGKIENIAIEESVMVTKPEDRVSSMGLMYNIRGTVNPLNGDYHGPNTVGIINETIHLN